MTRETVILRAAATHYLRFKRQCSIVLWERGVWPCSLRPDVLGITEDWRVIEIELKRTLSDFRANAGKRIGMAAEFWFFVPGELVDVVLREASKVTGVASCAMEGPVNNLKIHREASCNQWNRLTTEQFFVAVRLQSATLASAAREMAKYPINENAPALPI